MKVSITFDFSDDERLALADRIGQDNAYTRAQLLAWMESTVRADLDVVVSDHTQERERIQRETLRDHYDKRARDASGPL